MNWLLDKYDELTGKKLKPYAPERRNGISITMPSNGSFLDSFRKPESTSKITVFILCCTLAFLVVFMIWFAKHPESFSNGNQLGMNLSEAENAFNGLYYWGTLTSTVGFGDICPVTIASKSVTVVYQLFITLASLGILWKVTDKQLDKLAKNTLGSVAKKV